MIFFWILLVFLGISGDLWGGERTEELLNSLKNKGSYPFVVLVPHQDNWFEFVFKATFPFKLPEPKTQQHHRRIMIIKVPKVVLTRKEWKQNFPEDP